MNADPTKCMTCPEMIEYATSESWCPACKAELANLLAVVTLRTRIVVYEAISLCGTVDLLNWAVALARGDWRRAALLQRIEQVRNADSLAAEAIA